MTCQSYAWCCAHSNYDNIQTSVGDCHREDNCELKIQLTKPKKLYLSLMAFTILLYM